MTHLLEDLRHLVEHSPTSFHAVVEMGDRLASLDFIPLSMDEKWDLEKGKKYFVTSEGSIAAFVLPEKKPTKLSLIASHTDSPALKLKPRPEIRSKNMIMLGVEVYGGPILPTWLNRELAIAGRVVVSKKNGALVEHLVSFDDAPVIIPLIAPHLEREGYKKGLVLDKQQHLRPLATLQGEDFNTPYLEALLKREITFQKLLDFDLFLVPIEPPRYIGMDAEMLSGYRLDNLTSAHAALVALGNIKKAASTHLPFGLFWDHEEIGSSTRTGADSPFFHDIYKRLTAFYKLSAEEEAIMRNKSLCLSVDVTHAYNPNFEKKYDPEHHPLLGEGITIKYNANMRYSTTARSGAYVAAL